MARYFVCASAKACYFQLLEQSFFRGFVIKPIQAALNETKLIIPYTIRLSYSQVQTLEGLQEQGKKSLSPRNGLLVIIMMIVSLFHTKIKNWQVNAMRKFRLQRLKHGLLLSLLRETTRLNSMPYPQVELKVIIMVTMISTGNQLVCQQKLQNICTHQFHNQVTIMCHFQ